MITMPPESGIIFSFPEDSIPIKYEACAPYKKKIMPLQNACAVDFLCYYDNRLTFIEVMRFAEKPLSDPCWIANKITTQIKDTICGLAIFHMTREPMMEKYAQALFAQSPTKEKHKLIAFLEIENISAKLAPDTVKANVLAQLKARFVPLGFAVRVLDSHNIAKTPWKAEVQ